MVRIAGADGPRFAVLDYKTNWLGGPDEPLAAWHYRPAALAAEMLRRHYALQALLYTVALHRYLRWRVPGYDPARQLAGVIYLFLRGMTGPDTPVVDGAPCGVFGWKPRARSSARSATRSIGGRQRCEHGCRRARSVRRPQRPRRIRPAAGIQRRRRADGG